MPLHDTPHFHECVTITQSLATSVNLLHRHTMLLSTYLLPVVMYFTVCNYGMGRVGILHCIIYLIQLRAKNVCTTLHLHSGISFF